jgi:hypothetical protein
LKKPVKPDLTRVQRVNSHEKTPAFAEPHPSPSATPCSTAATARQLKKGKESRIHH